MARPGIWLSLPTQRTEGGVHSSPRAVSPKHWGWVLVGLSLLAIHIALLELSAEFPYGRAILDRPIVDLVILLVLSGVVYLCAVWLLLQHRPRGQVWWLWMVAVGLGMRTLMFFSMPIMDDDFYRYLWDGALVAHGHNPYERAPAEFAKESLSTGTLGFGDSAEHVMSRVNHPWLSTIYPPAAQVAFGLAHVVRPWHISGLRIVWLLADLLTVVLLVRLLSALDLPRSHVLIYWWNPILIKEVYNTAHMDALIAPLIVGALLLAIHRKPIWASAFLAVAVAVKVWPLLLLPVLLRSPGMRTRKMVAAAVLFAGVAGLCMAPLLANASNTTSGLAAYADYWEMNDALYVVIHKLASLWTVNAPHLLARTFIMIILALLIGWLCRSSAHDGKQMCSRALWIIAALFFLSPTQFPWYWLWMLPLLTIIPSSGLLLLSATLPLYYLRFYLLEIGRVNWFDYGIVWLEFAPAILLLIWEARKSRQEQSHLPLKALAVHER